MLIIYLVKGTNNITYNKDLSFDNFNDLTKTNRQIEGIKTMEFNKPHQKKPL